MKARLKSIVLSALGVLATFSAVTYTSCNEDKCKAIVCAYGGTCQEGECLCPTGYEGVQCETISRNKFLGTYTVTETGTISRAAQYAVAIEPGAEITAVQIKNFQNRFTEPVSARVKFDTLFIPQQTVNGAVVEGIGYLSDELYYSKHGQIIMEYTVTENGRTNNFGTVPGSQPSRWNK